MMGRKTLGLRVSRKELGKQIGSAGLKSLDGAMKAAKKRGPMKKVTPTVAGLRKAKTIGGIGRSTVRTVSGLRKTSVSRVRKTR